MTADLATISGRSVRSPSPPASSQASRLLPTCPARYSAWARLSSSSARSASISPIFSDDGVRLRVCAGAQRLQVAVDGADAAAVAEGGDLGVQHGGVVAALVPPAVPVRLVAVQDRGPGDGPGHRLITGGGVGEAAGWAARTGRAPSPPPSDPDSTAPGQRKSAPDHSARDHSPGPGRGSRTTHRSDTQPRFRGRAENIGERFKSPLGHITSCAELRFVPGTATKPGKAAGHSHGGFDSLSESSANPKRRRAPLTNVIMSVPQ